MMINILLEMNIPTSGGLMSAGDKAIYLEIIKYFVSVALLIKIVVITIKIILKKNGSFGELQAYIVILILWYAIMEWGVSYL